MRGARLLLALIVPACGAGPTRTSLSYADRAREAYERAMEDFENDNCVEAEPAFREVRREFPYSRYAALAELRIADCLLAQGKHDEAIAAYRRFTRSRPSHPEVPYARFRVAEAHFQRIPDEWLLSPPAYERDQGPTRDALQQLRRFLEDYPEDERAGQARRMERRCLELLARHELYVARFYLDRDRPLAAIGRLRTALRAYEGSGVEAEALLLLGRTYLHLRDRHQARRAFEELVTRFPRSGYAAQARAYLDEMGRAG
ncbi:MAG: outer membrane protein assembly factor BamD [Myxococcales bacterium]|nr:outer membrane protein assembly factor BamD [Myxococcales bacterium]